MKHGSSYLLYPFDYPVDAPAPENIRDAAAAHLASNDRPAESLVLINELLDPLLIRWRRPIAALANAPVMPEFRRQYKSDPVTNYNFSAYIDDSFGYSNCAGSGTL